jgi:hypothetical protein
LPGLVANATMKEKHKDRLFNTILILFFTGLILGLAYWIYRIMITWRVKELGP